MIPHYNIDRYVLQLYPPLILLAAAGSAYICARWRRVWLHRIIAGVLVLSWCLIPWFFKDQIRGKTRLQYANSAVIALEKRLTEQKPVFVLQGISILFYTLKFDCHREVYPIDSLPEKEVARMVETRGAYYILRSQGFGWPQLPPVIRQYHVAERARLDPGDPYGSPPYYVYEILPRKLEATRAGAAGVFFGAPREGDSHPPLHFCYIAGEQGVAAGGGMRIQLPETWIRSMQQISDLEASGSVVVGAGPDGSKASPEVILIEEGVEIYLAGGLREGEVITLTCGPDAIGRDFSLKEREGEETCFSFFIDMAGDRKFQTLPSPVCIH